MQISNRIESDIVSPRNILISGGHTFHGDAIDVYAVVIVAVTQVQQPVSSKVSRIVTAIRQPLDTSQNFVFSIGTNPDQLVVVHLDTVDISISGSKSGTVDFETSLISDVRKGFVNQIDF